LNHDFIQDQLSIWLSTFVEIPNQKLGNWSPCPYARRARIDNKISIIFADDHNFIESINHAKKLLESKEVVVICFDHLVNSADYVQQFVKNINKILMKEDFVVLEDHPDIPESINGVCMNFQECGLLLMQQLSKLQEASSQLRSKGYYDTWTTRDLDNVVTWRQN